MGVAGGRRTGCGSAADGYGMIRSALVASVSSAVCFSACGQVLFEQLPTGATYTAPISDSAYDDDRYAEEFVIENGDPVGRVVVWGAYLAPTPAQPLFTVDIYSYFAGLPDELICSEQVSPVSIVPTGVVGVDGVAQLEVTLELSVPFLPDDGRLYFVSVTADSADRNEGAWVWNEGVSGGSFAGYQAPMWYGVPGALAFRLESAGTEPCAADTNGDGSVTPADYNGWILAYNAGSAACDQNGDGQCTPADYNAWILNYNAGCP